MFVVSAIPQMGKDLSASVVDSFKHLWENHKSCLLVTAAIGSLVAIHHTVHTVKKKKLRQEWDSAGENVVVLHATAKATTCPNASPFVLKLETYLRMSGIKYVLDSSIPFGPKGKMPWITLNGEDYSDSQLIVEFLGQKFNKNFSSSLTSEEMAIGRSLLMMSDEHLFWGILWWRFLKDPDQRLFDLLKLPFFFKWFLYPIKRKNIRKSIWAQGLGRHSEADIVEMMRKDIEALSLYLGEKPFLMGSTPCEVDCAVFGIIAQFVWVAPGSPFASMIQTDYRNLLQYCLRMREKFWPDWEDCLIGRIKD